MAEIIQLDIINLYKIEPNNDRLKQTGLLDGFDIVLEYIDNNEIGCAVEHILYMTNESGVIINESYVEKLNFIANDIGATNRYLK